jgi:hypothetical protein
MIPYKLEIQTLFAHISVYRLYGVVPLGMLLHISISAIIAFFLLSRGMKLRNVAIVVFAIGLSKEIIDCFVINNTIQKHILDMCYNMSFVFSLYIKRKIQTIIKNLKH